MVRLLENPMLIEHESFTELLQAVFHLTAKTWAPERPCESARKRSAAPEQKISAGHIIS